MKYEININYLYIKKKEKKFDIEISQENYKN